MQVKIIPHINIMYGRIYFKVLSIINQCVHDPRHEAIVTLKLV
jgi:hypothetical protein